MSRRAEPQRVARARKVQRRPLQRDLQLPKGMDSSPGGLWGWSVGTASVRLATTGRDSGVSLGSPWVGQAKPRRGGKQRALTYVFLLVFFFFFEIESNYVV